MEGETKQTTIGALKKGNYAIIDDIACIIKDTQTSRPGKHGHAKVRLEAVGMIDEKKRIIVMPGHDNVEVPVIEKKTAQVLSVSDDSANVMDNQSYETFDLKIPEELKGKVVEGVEIQYWEILGDKVMKEIKGGQ